MSGAFVGVLLAVLCAVGVLFALLSERRPADGWRAWLRQSVDAWRADELSREKVAVRGGEVRDTPLGSIFDLDQPAGAPAYTRPEELVARLEQMRGRARSATSR